MSSTAALPVAAPDADPASLSLELVTSLEGLRSLAAQYERLNRLAGNRLPFALHEWHVTWCEHFLSTRGPIRDELRVFVARACHGECVGIVPLFLNRRIVAGLDVLRTLRMVGADAGQTEVRECLVAPGFEAAVARVLQAHLAQDRDWSWAEWSGCNEEYRQALDAMALVQWEPPTLDYIIDLPDSWEAFRAGLRRNIRESLRHGYNSLRRDGLRSELVVTAEPGGIGAAIDRFLQLHDQRARLQGTVQHRNLFASDTSQAFLRALAARFAQRGIVRVFELKVGEQIVAARIGFVVADCLYLYYSGFDPEWGRYGVMTTTVAEAIRYAIGQGLRCVNLSPGTDVSKTRWGPRAVPLWRGVQASRHWRSRAARICFERVRAGEGLWGRMMPLLRPIRRQW